MIRVIYLASRGSLGVIKHHTLRDDKDLNLTVPVQKPVVVVNPKSCTASKQVDYAFTFEVGPSDYLVKDDGVYGIAEFVDKNGLYVPQGTTKGFTCANFDEMLSILDQLLTERRFWNSRNRSALEERRASLNKYFFTTLDERKGDLYSFVYKSMGLSEWGSYEDLEGNA